MITELDNPIKQIWKKLRAKGLHKIEERKYSHGSLHWFGKSWLFAFIGSIRPPSGIRLMVYVGFFAISDVCGESHAASARIFLTSSTEILTLVEISSTAKPTSAIPITRPLMMPLASPF